MENNTIIFATHSVYAHSFGWIRILKQKKIYTNVINFTERKNLEVEPVITKTKIK